MRRTTYSERSKGAQYFGKLARERRIPRQGGQSGPRPPAHVVSRSDWKSYGRRSVFRKTDCFPLKDQGLAARREYPVCKALGKGEGAAGAFDHDGLVAIGEVNRIDARGKLTPVQAAPLRIASQMPRAE